MRLSHGLSHFRDALGVPKMKKHNYRDDEQFRYA